MTTKELTKPPTKAYKSKALSQKTVDSRQQRHQSKKYQQ